MERKAKTMCQQDIREALAQNKRAFDQLEVQSRTREALRKPTEHTLFVSPFTAGEAAQMLGRDR